MKRFLLLLSALAVVAAQDGALPPEQQAQGHGEAPPQQAPPDHNPGEIRGDPAHEHFDPPPHDPAHPSNHEPQHAVGETAHEAGG